MVPRKTAITGAKVKEAKKATVMKAVKRPARGYHKFRNGMLNVTPKGNENELVQENKKSPLLRLPPEIRNSIWAYVLGGKTYRTNSGCHRPWHPSFQASSTEPQNGMALLRVCRQIYAEAALMPLALNKFAVHDMFLLKDCLKKLRPYQRRQITSLHVELTNMYSFWGQLNLRFLNPLVPKFLSGIKSFHVCIFRSTSSTTAIPNFEDIRQMFELAMTGDALVEVFVEDTDLDWASYNRSFNGVISESEPTTSLTED